MATKKIDLTIHEIADRLEEAALTMKRLPAKDGPKGYGSSWPPYVQSRFTAYGSEAARVRVVPNAREIQRMEEAIEWLMLITGQGDEERAADDRKIVWMRAELMPWRAVCGRVGLSRSQAWRRHVAALITLQKRLASGGAKTGSGRRPKASASPGANSPA